MIKRLSSVFEGEGYQARAFRGSLLSVVGLGGQNAMRLASNLILTRLLFPEAFGVMALVQVVLAASSLFSDLGIRGSIIHHDRGEDPVFLNTAWSVQILRGVFLWLVITALAGPLAEFYEEPLLGEVLLVCALAPVLQGFNATNMATTSRTLQLGRLTAMTLGAQAIGVLATIALAWWLGTVWALAYGTLAAPLATMIMSHVVLKGHRNRPGFQREALSSLFRFGRFVFLATFASFFLNHGARAVLGKFVTLDMLAFYNIGHFLAYLPNQVIGQIAERVIYPLYARRPPAESERNRRKINVARRVLTAGSLVGVGILALIGDWLVRLMYDARYETAGPLLILIALASMPLLIIRSYHNMPLANGHSGKHATYTISRAIVQLGILFILVPRYGVLGAALAPGLGAILTYPLLVWIIQPYKGWDPLHDALAAIAAIAITLLVFRVNAPVLEAYLATL